MSPTSPRLPATRHPATAPPFKVHRGSHLIHKQSPSAAGSSSSSSNSSVTSSSGSGSGLTATNNGAAHRPPPRQHKQQQQPVIIYTHSPKVIRTNPRDFMSIVQKLTGLESSVAARAGVCPPGANKEAGSAATSQEESSSSTTDSCVNQAHIAAPPPSYVDPHQMPPPPLGTHFMPPEIPLFAPAGGSELPLCASRGLYGSPFAPVVSSSANMNSAGGGTVFSPTPGVAFPDH